MPLQTTIERLREMRLRGMADALVRQQQQPELQSLSFEERLELLVDQEWLDRQNRRLARLLKEVKFRVAACMEDVDYQHPRGLDRTVMRSLAAC
ncbi:putative transposase subunit [Symbiobacterium thermophilum IAM 14863]|uniref:Putative transposase subunit n=1 Tax=Symbiobacterium thermophilum (strain DSM 24528 / JCM 14929 / IAM 14863 / T) TaxID=292459 RepID=Q67TF6_SYMTH|nr:putative transposase subunit [Symbiobacterium thermophilum IAM 14863]